MNEVINSLKAFNDPEILVKFCDVLKIQDDPNLVRIANTMLKELGKYCCSLRLIVLMCTCYHYRLGHSKTTSNSIFTNVYY